MKINVSHRAKLFRFVPIGFRLFHVVLGCCTSLCDVSFVLGCVTLPGFFRFFFNGKNCVNMFWVVQMFLWLFVDCFLVILGRLGMCWLFWVSRSEELTSFMQFQVVMNCLGCFRLCLVMLGCVRLPLIQVVVVLSVVFVCSGLFFYSIELFDVDVHFVFVFLHKFGFLGLFHDVSHCFSCFLSLQVEIQFRCFYVVLFGWFILFQVAWKMLGISSKWFSFLGLKKVVSVCLSLVD